MANTVDKAIKVFKSEVGYQEKKTNSGLDDKHKNVGSANYTKYGKEMGCNGLAWCLAFCEWVMVQAYGKETAKKMLGGFSNYTPTGAAYFQNMKRWSTEPKVGDFVFFYSTKLKRIAHVGFVYKVDDKKVYTIEGNTSSSATEFERDGGCVAYKEYSLNDPKIKGYGHPKYDEYVPTTTISKDSSEEDIAWLQENLNKCLEGTKGFVKLEVDSDYGNKTKEAVLLYWDKLRWNKDNVSDGTNAGIKTITALISGRTK